MPSVSKKQHNLMALVANNPKAAKRLKIPQSVGEEFMKADKGKKFKEGGPMKHSDIAKDKPMMEKVAKKAVKGHEKKMHKMAGGGSVFRKAADGVASKGKTKATMIKMNRGGAC
jgi:hypothetical protein